MAEKVSQVDDERTLMIAKLELQASSLAKSKSASLDLALTGTYTIVHRRSSEVILISYEA